MKALKSRYQSVITAITDLGYEHRSYSGRFMYGRQCLAITIESNTNSYGVIADIMQYLLTGLADETERLDLYASEIFSNTALDNLGLGYILYFPNIEVSDEAF